MAQCFLASVDLQRGDAQAAVERLEPTRRRAIAAGAGLALSYTETFLASARAAVGETAESRAALEGLVVIGLDQGYLLASALLSLADLHRISGELSDAAARADRALDIVTPFGSPLGVAAANEMLGRVAPEPALTPTEVRVVKLVAEGRTNPQIAERMFISRGTVKVHLSHIFAKVGVGTRSELAAQATRRSLTGVD